VSDAAVHPSVQRVLDAAARKGVTLDVVTFDESTHTAIEAAAAVGAELGQIVKSLLFVIPGAAGLDPVLCLVAGHNRVDLGARGRHERPGHPTCDGARGPRPHRVRHRRGAADRAAQSGAGDHGSRPRALPGRLGGGGLSTTVFAVPPGTLRILANATVAPIAEERSDADRVTSPTSSSGATSSATATWHRE
jgi:hypothetical protein